MGQVGAGSRGQVVGEEVGGQVLRGKSSSLTPAPCSLTCLYSAAAALLPAPAPTASGPVAPATAVMAVRLTANIQKACA